MNNRQYYQDRKYDIKDKDYAMTSFIEEMISKTIQIFEYENLPEDIADKADRLETFLQTNGNVFFTKVDGKLYFFTGGLGGQYDAYYMPTIYTVANPYLNYSAQLDIDKDGVLMRNDTFANGLLPLIKKYGTMMIEANISINNSIINTRDYNAFSAQDSRTKASAELYQQQIEAGNTAVISERSMVDSLKRHAADGKSGIMTELKELRQYIKAQLYSDLGMKTAHNMKSQYVSDAENIINDDTLLPLVQDMLMQRQKAIDKLNAMYDLDIKVKLNGTWRLQQEKVEQEIEMIEEGKLLAENDLSLEEMNGEVEQPEEQQEQQPEEQQEEQNEEQATEAENTEEEQDDKDIDIDIEINIDDKETREPLDVLNEEIGKLEDNADEKD